MMAPVNQKSTGKGRGAVRDVAIVSFHSLRHHVVSMLKADGVLDATLIALVGHETLAMSSHYTHVGKASLEAVVASLPGFSSVQKIPLSPINSTDSISYENATSVVVSSLVFPSPGREGG